MAGGDHGNQRHEAAMRRDRVLELRDQGLTFREIGAELGISHQRAYQLHDRAIRERPALAASAELAEERKQAQLRRIDMQREIHEAIITAAHKTVTVSGKVLDVEDHGPVFAATDRLVKLDDQEAKLLGLNAKTEISHSGDLAYHIVGVAPEDLM